MRKQDITEVPTFPEGEWITGLVTLVSCGISALALSYHVWTDLKVEQEAIRWAFTVLAGLFALLMGIVPMSLARAHGNAMEGGNAQTGLLALVILFMAVDASLQVHAVSYGMKLMEMQAIDVVWLFCGAGAFQIAAFFVRGQLFAVTREIRDLIEAREQHLKEVAAYAKERELAKRRQRYHENRAGLHIV